MIRGEGEGEAPEVEGIPVHVGLRVEYGNSVGIEWGKVTSWNSQYVFVLFDGGWQSKACVPWVLRLEGEVMPRVFQNAFTIKMAEGFSREELSRRNHFLWVDYTNWHENRSWRRVIPIDIECAVVQEHGMEPAWLLNVLMEDRNWARRSLLMRSIHEIKPGGPSPLSYGNALPLSPERPTPP